MVPAEKSPSGAKIPRNSSRGAPNCPLPHPNLHPLATWYDTSSQTALPGRGVAEKITWGGLRVFTRLERSGAGTERDDGQGEGRRDGAAADPRRAALSRSARVHGRAGQAQAPEAALRRPPRGAD